MGLRRLLLITTALGVWPDRLDAVAHLRRGKDPERRRDPRVGYLHQPDRKRASTPGTELLKKARRSMYARGVPDATGQMEHREAELPR